MSVSGTLLTFKLGSYWQIRCILVLQNGRAKNVSYIPAHEIESFDGLALQFPLNDVIVNAYLALDKAFTINNEAEVTVVGKVFRGVLQVHAGYNDTKGIIFQQPPSVSVLITLKLTLPVFFVVFLILVEGDSPISYIGLSMFFIVSNCCAITRVFQRQKSLEALKDILHQRGEPKTRRLG